MCQFNSRSILLLWLLLLITYHGEANLTPQSVVVSNTTERPRIYTYFEHIPQQHRTTGMSDEDDGELLQLWSDLWSAAGWDPVVLNLTHILGTDSQDKSTSEETKKLHQLVDRLHLDHWGRVLFHRWIAMWEVGGGWYADYDVLPMHSMPQEGIMLPNQGRMTMHDIMSPTLASGSADQWLLTTKALLDDATSQSIPVKRLQNQSNFTLFWTDSLGVHNLVKKHGWQQSPTPLTGKRVYRPYDPTDPVVTRKVSDCHSRAIRNRWVVHFEPRMMQAARFVPAHLRHPRYRRQLAMEWLPRWKDICLPQNDTTLVTG